MDLGLKLKDKISGFEGIATGRADYLTGCSQYLLQPPAKDGNFIEGRWFDEGRLEITGQGIKPESVLAAENGCDMPAPVK